MKVRGQTVYTAEERIARLTRIGWVDWRYADKMESGNERD